METPRMPGEYPRIVYLLQAAFDKQGIELTSWSIADAWQDAATELGLDQHE
jgi:hypothetical protein